MTTFTQDDIWHLLDSLFDYYSLVHNQIESYNQLISEFIPRFFAENRRISVGSTKSVYTLEFGDMKFEKPFHKEINDISDEIRAVTTMECISRDISYVTHLYIDITVTNPQGDETLYENIHLATLPVMARSNLCNLYAKDDVTLMKSLEDPFDLGGYFILNGVTKNLIAQERTAFNKIYIFTKRKKNPKYPVYVEVRSASPIIYSHSTTAQVGILPNETVSVIVPYIEGVGIPIGIIFKALGCTKEEDIIKYVMWNFGDDDMMGIIIKNLEYTYTCKTQEAALVYIGKKAKKFTSENSEETRVENKKKKKLDTISQAILLIDSEFLPHIGQSAKYRLYKVCYIARMYKMLLEAYLGRRNPDDRDGFDNKRIARAGDLLYGSFVAGFKRMISCLNKSLNASTKDSDRDFKVINYLKTSEIAKSITKAIKENKWGSQNMVASQQYEAFNYTAGLSNLRRLVTTINKNGEKIDAPRRLHGSQWQLCVTGDTVVMLTKTMDGIPCIKIKDLHKTEKKVICVCPKTLKVTATDVKDIFIIEKPEVEYLLCIKTDSKASLKCTENHSLLEFKNKKIVWTEAKNLRVGSKLIIVPWSPGMSALSIEEEVEIDGKKVTVVWTCVNSIKKVTPECVYDITTVSENHSFVGNGFILHNCCSAETPEGKKVGIVKNISLLSLATTGCNPEPIIKAIKKITSVNIRVIDEIVTQPFIFLRQTCIFVNGNIIGYTNEPKQFVQILRELRYKLVFSYEVSISFNSTRDEIQIFTDGGRLCRPLLRVKDGELVLRSVVPGKAWISYLVAGEIEIIDKLEEYDYLVCQSVSDFYELKFEDKLQYTHCEIEPSTMFGVNASIIPFSNRDHAPKVTYQSAMSKQAIGVPCTNFQYHIKGKLHVMLYPQRPITATRASKIVQYHILSAGQNGNVAVMPFFGLNQEDSVIINQDSVDRGFMNSLHFICFDAKIKDSMKEQFGIPTKELCGNFKGNADKLDENGIIKKTVHINTDDILIGLIKKREDTTKKEFVSISILYNQITPGKIHSIQQGIDAKGYKYVRICVSQLRIPIVGDKFCFTKDHQLLTTHGWIGVSKITKSMKVASLQGEKLVYEFPTHITKFKTRDKLYEFRCLNNLGQCQNSAVPWGSSLCVTKEHRMYVLNLEGYKMVSAQELYTHSKGKKVIFKKTALLGTNNPNKDSFSLIVGKTLNMNSWLSLFGRWWSENTGDTLRKTSRIIEHLRVLKINHTIREKTIIITDQKVLDYLNQHFSLPYWVWMLSVQQARILLDAIFNYKQEMTVHKKEKDDLMRLGLHAGVAIDGIIQSRGSKTVWRVRYAKEENYEIAEVSNESQGKRVRKKRVYCCTVPSGLLYVRRRGTAAKGMSSGVWTGNSALHGQKGTAGALVKSINLPFDRQGITPDICLNPCALPSRMTLGMLVEMFASKRVLTSRKLYNAVITRDMKLEFDDEVDATPFNNKYDLVKILNEEMKKLGESGRFGEERLKCGITGQYLNCLVFSGICYYQRLKHMVIDKAHARSYGKKANLTRQPREGRKVKGGLKIGHMERDILLAQGVQSVVRDRLLEQSDVFKMWLCDICGWTAVYNKERNMKECRLCQNSSISVVKLPYGAKLLRDELAGMGIIARMIPAK